jgi:PAS domain S-box-containing protein
MAASADSAVVRISDWMRRVPFMYKNPFRLFGAKIGTRLAACFLVIVLSMMAADLVAVWQFRQITAQGQRLSQADETSLAVVRVRLDVDTVRDKLATLASTHDIRQFTTEAASLRQKFLEDVTQSQELLRSSADRGQDPAIASALETLRITLPSQLETTVELALAGDWSAVSLRVRDQVQALIDLSSLLVEKVDREVSQERAQAIAGGRRARRQLVLVLPIAALLTLLIAVALGWYTTRSITEPLLELDAGTRALARGDFHHQVTIQGEDELAHLGRVFNDTAGRLAALYQMLRSSEAHLRLTIDTIPAYVWSALPDGSLDFLNRRLLEFSGVSLEEVLGWGWQAAVHPDDLARFVDEWRAAVACGKAMESEARIRRADGQFRWLLIRNVPLHDEGERIVKWYGTGTDIDDRKRAEETLREQADLLNLTHDTVFVADLEGVIRYWNRGAAERYGWTAEQVVGTVVHELLKTVFPKPRGEIIAGVTRTGRWEGELLHTRKDGTQVVVASRWSLQSDERGTPVAILETNNDITERKRAEEALYRLNRELLAIRNCNQALLRATDEQSLLQEICRIICEEAGYGIAWVAYAEHDQAKSMRPVAWAGREEGYLATAGITWADTERGRGPTGTAIRSGKTCCIQDFTTDPRLTPWRESALRRDVRSGIALPLMDEHANAFGSLTIYSEQPNAFTSEEIRLLEELAADLAFGVVTLRSRAARERAEQEVALLNFALDRVREAVFLVDDTGHFRYVNEEACRVLGYARAQLLGWGVSDINPEMPAERWPDHWRELKAQRSLSFESRHRARDGRTFPVEISANYFEYGGGAYNLALVRDITERKRAEEALRRSEAYLADAQSLSHTGSWALDLATERYDYWSEEMFRIFRFDRQEGLPSRERVFRRIHEEDRNRWQENFEKSLREKLDSSDEYRIVLPEGTVKHIHSIRHPVLNSTGDVVKLVGTAIDITERKRAEEALRRSEAYLAEAQTLTHTGTFVSDGTTKPLYWSEEMFRIFGFDPHEGIPARETTVQRIHPEDRSRWKENLEKTLCEKVDTSDELRIVLPDGTIKYVYLVRHPVLNDAGELVEVVGTTVDITERKHAEEALRRSEAYLTEAQRLAHTGSWAWSPATLQSLYWSEEMFRLFGLNAQEGLPTAETYWQRIHPEDLDRTRELLLKVAAENMEYEHEHRIVLPDGTVKHIHAIGHPVLDENGKVAEYVGTAVDVTERKRAEEALRRSEAYLAEAQRLSHTGSWASECTGRPLYWSEEVFRIFGLNPQQGIPTPDQPLQRIHPEDLDKFLGTFNRAVQAKVDFEVEARVVLPDGTVRHIHGIGHPVLNANGEIVEVVGTVVDITERKRAEEERERLRQLEADLAHINRVSMMGELAASIAHEVNQPLSGVVSNGSACLRWLAGEPPNLDEARETARRIVRDGKRAGEVIARIRALTKRAVTPREKLDLNETIQDVLALVGDEAKKTSAIIRTQFADDLSPVSADRVQLQQVVLNLVMNGIEAMSSVGDRARELVIMTRSIDPDQVQVTVEDSGTGIDPQKIDKIFDSFYTTKPGGMGMGLPISRSILQAHGGRLWATAKDSAGTIFCFTLPKYHEEGPHAGVAGV